MEIQDLDVLLSDGRKYSGWGYFDGNNFIPHGCGKKTYDDFYVFGNYVNGILNGPALNSHDFYMYTGFYKNNRGNGWGLMINCGTLVEFGYYSDSQLTVNLTDFVYWYYEKMTSYGRDDERMFNIYSSKENRQVTELLIGYSAKKLSAEMALSCMGFRFMPDGSVWVGTTATRRLSGYLLHFTPSGVIDAGYFQDGELIERMSLHGIIDYYYGIVHYDEDDDFVKLILSKHPKSTLQIENEQKREEFRDVDEINVFYDYIHGHYINDVLDPFGDDLPF